MLIRPLRFRVSLVLLISILLTPKAVTERGVALGVEGLTRVVTLTMVVIRVVVVVF